MPVHYAIDEERLVRMGLHNYWGYNSIGFFCPDPPWRPPRARARGRDEFRHMVRALHAAGIEVLLDVVFNHTAEGDAIGPVISLRGLDNAGWYRMQADDPGAFENWSGCGNTLDIRQPHALRLVLDSLRHWVSEMHVDGFRFDLAPVLGAATSASAASIRSSRRWRRTRCCRVKLIAEPPGTWGPAATSSAGFPAAGWSGTTASATRCAPSGWAATGIRILPHAGHAARRVRDALCGSSDLFQARRAPGRVGQLSSPRTTASRCATW